MQFDGHPAADLASTAAVDEDDLLVRGYIERPVLSHP